MALHRMLDIEIGVADPATLDAFYQEIGFVGGDGLWGAADQPAMTYQTTLLRKSIRSYPPGGQAATQIQAEAEAEVTTRPQTQTQTQATLLRRAD